MATVEKRAYSTVLAAMLTGAEFRPPESQEFIGIEYTRRRAIFTYARRRQVGGFPVRSVTQIVGKVLWTLRWRGAKAAVAGLDPAYELEALKSAKKRPDDLYGPLWSASGIAKSKGELLMASIAFGLPAGRRRVRSGSSASRG